MRAAGLPEQDDPLVKSIRRGRGPSERIKPEKEIPNA
jgi:hypothetical protein